MNQDTWNALTAKIAERDDLQTRLDDARAEVQKLVTSLEADLAALHESESATAPDEPAPEAV